MNLEQKSEDCDFEKKNIGWMGEKERACISWKMHYQAA